MFARSLPLLLLLACGGNEKTPDRVADLGQCDGAGPEQVLVARSLLVSREDGGVSDGFDLDGADSSGGCGVTDYVDSDGVEGIDNALAALMPILEATEAVVLEALVQDSINGGALLLMFGLSDLDDLSEDECVEVDVFKGLGIPMIGADGWLLPNQTLDINPDTPVTTAPVSTLADGRLEVGPIEEVWLTIAVLDLNASFKLSNVMVRLEPLEDGTWAGMIAGGITIQDIIDVVTLQNVDDSVFDLVGPALELMADLAPDDSGDCTELSMTLKLEAVPAFLYP